MRRAVTAPRQIHRLTMSSQPAPHEPADPPAATEVVDPVCGMTIDRADSVGEHQYRGATYYFCNPHCLEQFRADPERYLRPDRQVGPPAEGGSRLPSDAEYTCPMDPE